MINESIAKLVKYGENAGLVSGLDKIYATNRILEVMQISDYEEPEQIPENPDLEETLNELLDDAAKRGLLEHNSVVYRDLFDTKLMDCLMPRPGEVVKKFEELYAKSPQEATDYFYKLSQDSNYIRRYRIAKDIRWSVPSAYGDIDISINLSKPEKDPKAIAAAKLAKQSGYPKCLLCKENVGYAGRVNHPARQNHRIIPLTINQTEWGFQYSPYVYYNEHCIVFNFQHNPMKIERATFVKLFDFIKLFPHYFIGSNADLPIVGGSILSHDHYQGGHYTFAMAKAPIERYFTIKGYEDVETGIVKWPLSVIRIRHKDEKRLIDLAEHNNGKFIPLKDIAERQEISEKYLESIVKSLTKADVLEGLRGKGGGYRLTRPAEEYNVYEILKLTEGSMAPVSCLEDTARECERRGMCATLPVWEGLEKVVREYLSGITIQELTKQWQPGDNYVI